MQSSVNGSLFHHNVEEAKALISAAGYPDGFDFDMYFSNGLYGPVYLQGVVSRSISDPLYGVPGDLALSVGVSVSLGRRSLGPPVPATLGASAGRGRIVRFVFERADARSVAVAGDFSEWEPRAMQRDAKGAWTLETVLEPGVYHYSFVVDGETWTVPANAPGLVDDGFGQKNATLVVTAAG